MNDIARRGLPLALAAFCASASLAWDRAEQDRLVVYTR